MWWHIYIKLLTTAHTQWDYIQSSEVQTLEISRVDLLGRVLSRRRFLLLKILVLCSPQPLRSSPSECCHFLFCSSSASDSSDFFSNYLVNCKDLQGANMCINILLRSPYHKLITCYSSGSVITLTFLICSFPAQNIMLWWIILLWLYPQQRRWREIRYFCHKNEGSSSNISLYVSQSKMHFNFLYKNTDEFKVSRLYNRKCRTQISL